MGWIDIYVLMGSFQMDALTTLSLKWISLVPCPFWRWICPGVQMALDVGVWVGYDQSEGGYGQDEGGYVLGGGWVCPRWGWVCPRWGWVCPRWGWVSTLWHTHPHHWHLVTATTRIVTKRIVPILLECFLVWKMSPTSLLEINVKYGFSITEWGLLY